MKLIDMKLPRKSKKEMAEEAVPVTGSSDDQDRYPYGLRLSFDDEQYEKIEALAKLDVGDRVIIQGVGVVVAKRENETQGQKKRESCEIQIEEIGVSGGKKPSQMTREELKEYLKK